MKTIIAIAKKEFKDYFFSPIAYVFITVFLVLSFWIFFSDFFVNAQASIRTFFNWVPVVFLVFLPAITMGKWSEEKKNGTLEILLTLPVKDWEVVLGKYVAAFSFLLVCLILTLPLGMTVNLLGDLDKGPVIGGYLGLVLMGATLIAIGLYVSSLTQSAIVSFIISFLLLFLLYVVGSPLVLDYLPELLVPLFASISLSFHFQSIARGVIDLRDVIYYVSMIGFFIYLNVLSLESRKWS